MDPKIIMNTVTEILIKTKGAKLKSIQEKISGLQKLVLENNAMVAYGPSGVVANKLFSIDSLAPSGAATLLSWDGGYHMLGWGEISARNRNASDLNICRFIIKAGTVLPTKTWKEKPFKYRERQKPAIPGKYYWQSGFQSEQNGNTISISSPK